MHIIAIGIDKKSLDKKSRVYKRLKEYSENFESFNMFTYSKTDIHINDEKLNIQTFNLFDIYKKVKNIKNKIKSNDICITSQDPFELGFISYILAKIFKFKLNLQIHTDISSIEFRKESYRNMFQYLLSRFTLKRADSIRVVSSDIRYFLCNDMGIDNQKVFLCPIANDIEINKGEIPLAERKTILMLSRIVPVKNIELGILSFIKYKEIYNNDFILKIIGSGDAIYHESLKKIAKDRSDIVFVDYTEDISKYYHEARVFLITSKYEGFCLTALEAIYHGTPVLMSNIGLANDYIKPIQNGYIVNNNDFVSGLNILDIAIKQNHIDQDIVIETIKDMPNKEYVNDVFYKSLSFIKNDIKDIIYAIPEFSINTHFKYNIDFLKALYEKGHRPFVIIEKGDIYMALKLFEHHLPIRLIGKNRLWNTYKYLKEAKSMGYKKIYIHYSFAIALISIFIKDLKSYYWNCGLPFLYKRGFIEEFYQRFVYKHIDYFITASESLAKQYIDYYKFSYEKVLLLTNYIDVDKMLYLKEHAEDIEGLNDKRVIFFMQRLSERKGAHYILPILKNMPDDVVMIVTGSGPYKDKLLEEIKENNLEKKFLYLGRVPQEYMSSILAKTDVFVLPSLEEGMSHALLEAMSLGVPSVCFDIGANKEMLPDDFKEFAVEYKNIDKFIEKILFLFINDSLREDYENALKDRVMIFDKEKVVKKFVELIIN